MWRHEINVETTISMNLCMCIARHPPLSSLTQNCRQWRRRRQQYWMYMRINKSRGWSIEILSEFFSASDAASFCYNIILPSHRHIKHILCINTREGDCTSERNFFVFFIFIFGRILSQKMSMSCFNIFQIRKEEETNHISYVWGWW